MQPHRIFASYLGIWHLFLVNGTIVSRTYTETAMPLGKSGRGTATPARVVPILFDELLPEHLMLEVLFMALIGGVGLSFMFDGGDDEPDEPRGAFTYDEENGLVTGSDDDDDITIPYDDNAYLNDITIDAGAGNDAIDLTGERDIDDWEWFNDGEINGDDGDDTITLDQVYDSVINGGDGDDVITANGSIGSTINGGLGDDYINPGSVSGDQITVNGGEGDDVIDGTPVDNGDLNGGEGDDTIYTGFGGPSGTGYLVGVDGGAGDDTLIYDNEGHWVGDTQRLEISGGEGIDTFDLTVHQGGTDTDGDGAPIKLLELRDFEPDVEIVQIETIPDEGATVTSAALEEDTAAGITTLTITYTDPIEGDIGRAIEIHANGVTWDDVDFVGDTPPAVLLPITYV